MSHSIELFIVDYTPSEEESRFGEIFGAYFPTASVGGDKDAEIPADQLNWYAEIALDKNSVQAWLSVRNIYR